VLVFIAALGVVTLLLTAFDSGAPSRSSPEVGAGSPPAVTSTPTPITLATVSNLQIQLPVAEEAVTQIGFHGSRTGALSLQPLGPQVNEGLLARLWHRVAGSPKDGPGWYQLGGEAGPGTEVLDVGAAPDTNVYAPVTGRVAAVTDYVIDGTVYGARIDIRPAAAPSVVVSLTHLRPDPALSVGSPVLAGISKIGSVVDVSAVETQALARYTNDDGNNVAIEVVPGPSTFP
jgi:hypothetical protein